MIIAKHIKLEIATPYMLRSDGRLLDCGEIHPYIKYIPQLDDESQIRDLLNDYPHWLKWYFDNTDHLMTKFVIYDFLAGVYMNNAHYNIKGDSLKYFLDMWAFDSENSNFSIEKTNKIFNWLNNAMNIEFTRIRMSNIRWGGDSRQLYCRISDPDIKNSGMWIRYIQQIVKEHADEIEDMSVVNDVQSLGGKLLYYRLNNKNIDHMPVNEFIGP